MKKVIIATLNSKYIHSSLAPWCLFTSAKKECSEDFNLSVFEGTVNENQELLAERLIKEKADIICFSCYIWNVEKILELCRRIKSNGNPVIILGGPEVAYRQKELLENNSFIDFIFSGEGERILPDFLKGYKKGDTENIKGASFRKDGKIVVSVCDDGSCEDYPSPYCEEYFESLKGRIAYIESCRGCPFSCAFCLSGESSRVRYFPVERVKKDILALVRHGAKTIKFVDRTFNCNSKRAKEILLFIKESYGKKIGRDVCFHFEIAAHICDEDFISLILSMPEGLIQLEIGIQSFNEKTLSAIGRRTDLERVEKTVRQLTEKANCHIHTDLIAGLPFEDYESFIRGFNRAYSLGANMLQLGFLKILHGSKMKNKKEDYPCTYSDNPPYEVIYTDCISEDELKKLHIAENELERLYNSGRFRKTLEYVLSESQITPYDLFYGCGVYLSETGNACSMPLKDYIGFVFEYFSSLEGITREKLRDVMIYDRIASDNTGILPSCLRVEDIQLKKIRQRINEISPMKKGMKRSVAVLYTQGKAIWSDYTEKSRVTGEYKVNEIILDK